MASSEPEITAMSPQQIFIFPDVPKALAEVEGNLVEKDFSSAEGERELREGFQFLESSVLNLFRESQGRMKEIQRLSSVVSKVKKEKENAMQLVKKLREEKKIVTKKKVKAEKQCAKLKLELKFLRKPFGICTNGNTACLGYRKDTCHTCLEDKLETMYRVLAEILDENKMLEETGSKLESKKRDLMAVQSEKTAMEEMLREEVLCPVCLALPRDNKIPMCKNSHITCVKCKRGNCPTCREEMTDSMFSTLALKITELVKHKCRNQVEGCSVSLYKESLIVHEQSCRFEENLPCPSLHCNQMVSLEKIMAHVEKCCQWIEPSEGSIHTIICRSNMFDDDLLQFDRQESEKEIHLTSGIALTTKYNDIVFVVTSKAENMFVFATKVLYQNKPRSYSIEMKVSNLNGTVSQSLTGEPAPIDKKIDSILEDGEALKVEDRRMTRIKQLEDDGNLFSFLLSVNIL